MKYLWRVDEFDSMVFGFKVAKIIDLDPAQVKNLITDLIRNTVAYATIRVKSNNFPLAHALEASGFTLVDGLISLSLDLSSLNPQIQSEIREARKSDLLQLKKMTSNLYTNTRITNDPKTRGFANKYYIKWVENSFKDEAADLVLVWEEKDQILGYITLQKVGQIPLIGVLPKAQGKGIARSLLNVAFAKLKKWGIEKVNIDTQMGNIPALRAYQGTGFKIVNSYLTFRWVR